MDRAVVRGSSHRRPRPESLRFNGGLIVTPMLHRNISAGIDNFYPSETYNWIGQTWMREFNFGMMPSLNQIEVGLIAEALIQLEEATNNIEDKKQIT